MSVSKIEASPSVPSHASPARGEDERKALHRDLSVAVVSVADVDERVRTGLGTRAAGLEKITILSQTRYLDLSTSARRRLGISPGQIHLQLRLVIRDLEGNLTSDEANELRDAVVGLLHEGAVRTWVSREMQL